MKKLTIILLLLTISVLKSEEFRHFPRIFVGGTTDMLEKHTSPSVGVEYMFAFVDTKPEIGVGLIAETAFGTDPEYCAAISLNIHLNENWRFFAAPGIRIIQYPTLDSTEINYKNKVNNDNSGNKFNMMLRFGTSYSFQYKDFYIEPIASIDLVNRHFSLVYGISFGLNF